MNTIKVNFHNEQEEKVLVSFLESLNYDYEAAYTDDEKVLIDTALERSLADSAAGRVYPHSEVMAKVKSRFNL